MKKTAIILMLFSALSSHSQNLNFQLIKNFPTYSESVLFDVLNKKGFYLINSHLVNPICDNIPRNGKYYSTDKERDFGNDEIAFNVYKKNKELLIEITFGYLNYIENFNSIFSKIQSTFKKEKNFYSTRYKSEVRKYSYNHNFYYVFNDEDYPMIVISNKRADECWFSN
jgi:hypothetical protein